MPHIPLHMLCFTMFYNFNISNGLGDAAKEEILRNRAALKQSVKSSGGSSKTTERLFYRGEPSPKPKGYPQRHDTCHDNPPMGYGHALQSHIPPLIGALVLQTSPLFGCGLSQTNCFRCVLQRPQSFHQGLLERLVSKPLRQAI